ncbi:hypothetical protein [Actinotignum urinale]|uniref:Uncharacterized protein n=1 Tax=Actinotignum urinale TaxID=190146 RepID=A0ABU5G8W7_9ACTO|nr:hypothetical protein [Actinotignum urinale]MDY5133543.1 hypothetical protein [Actinotignum urinale]
MSTYTQVEQRNYENKIDSCLQRILDTYLSDHISYDEIRRDIASFICEEIEATQKQAYTEGWDDAQDEENTYGEDYTFSSEYERGFNAGHAEGFDNAESYVINSLPYRVKDVFAPLGAQGKNNHELLMNTLGWVPICPYCHTEYMIEYRQNEQYVGICSCRGIYVHATSPARAAQKIMGRATS